IACASLFAALLLCEASGAGAQQAAPLPIVGAGDAVVAGFSGIIAPDPGAPLPANKTLVVLTFINPDGPSARIVDLTRPDSEWDASLWPATKLRDVLARDVGQVFGVALD